MKRVFLAAAAAVAVLAGAPPASAQLSMPGIDLGGGTGRQLTPEERAKRQEIERRYQSTINKVPDKPHSSDPWGNVRSVTPAKKSHGEN